VKLPENLNACLKIILQISSLSIIPQPWVDKGLTFFMTQAEIINKKIAPEEIQGF
jgi:hypothetical protein